MDGECCRYDAPLGFHSGREGVNNLGLVYWREVFASVFVRARRRKVFESEKGYILVCERALACAHGNANQSFLRRLQWAPSAQPAALGARV